KYFLIYTTQILIQKSTAVFRNNYLANYFSIDATNTVRQKPIKYTYIKYF
ncbi:hypothetical protein BO86DRAFT_327403, partial [Aspergillus japonicus CBS 114.51]